MENIKKQTIVSVARKLRLLPLLEKINFLVVAKKWCPLNRQYTKNNQVKLTYPPLYLMYDAYANCSYEIYDKTGLSDAQLIMQIIRKYNDNKQLTICEFGCGPARIIRHLHSTDKDIARLIGTDYNIKTIEYCKKFVPNVDFFTNQLSPPLNLPDNSIDVLYCVSVFTHLSKEMHFEWIKEIRRVLKPGGLFIGSFHGDNLYDKLLPDEKNKYLSGEIVERGNAKEGSRLYVAFHSDAFMKNKLLVDFDFIYKENTSFIQTIWCAK